ncbi:MAG: hypothetical protein HOV80_15350 [Polyangiaceae bacterium]|nr:hypothetical protein [Polyangiaceae bacterium]
MTRDIALASALVIGCSNTAPVEPVAVVASPPLRAAAPRASALPSTPTLPLATEGIDAHFAYLEKMCSPLSRFTAASGERFAACDCCPNYGESCKPQPPGAEIADTVTPMLIVDQMFRGSFRRAGADEMLMITSGCASAAENNGGVWIGDVEGGSLGKLAYESGDHPEACKKLPREEGIDRLLCTFTHGRAATSTHVLVNDYTRPDAGISARELVEVVSELSHVCSRGAGPITDNRVVSTRFADRDGDGRVDVEVSVSLRSGTVTVAALRKCKDGVFEGDPSSLLAAPKEGVLRFVGKPGRTFEPDAETKKLLARL